jgi:hypothetical protein
VHRKLEESTSRNSTKISGNLLLTSGTKVSPFGEKISNGESMGAVLEIGVCLLLVIAEYS